MRLHKHKRCVLKGEAMKNLYTKPDAQVIDLAAMENIAVIHERDVDADNGIIGPGSQGSTGKDF